MPRGKRPRLWAGEFWRAVNPETLSAGFHRAEPGWLSPVKNSVQTDFDVWYVAAGTGEVLIDGQWHAFEAGDLVTIKPGRSYQRERTGRPVPFQIYFAHGLPFGREDRGLNTALAEAWPLKMSLLHRPELVGIFNRLFEAFATRPPGPSLAVKGLTLQLLQVIFDELRRAPRPKAPRASVNLLRAKELIETAYAGDLRLADIAKGCELSPSHLSALFARHMGLSPVEYLISVRLREAKLRLARGARVKEVADAVGFHSQHHFCRLFKKKTGLTPTGFSRLHARG